MSDHRIREQCKLNKYLCKTYHVFPRRTANCQEMAERKAADEGKFLVGVALTCSRKSKFILKWALDKFLPEGDVTFKLIYVYPKITIVPTASE